MCVSDVLSGRVDDEEKNCICWGYQQWNSTYDKEEHAETEGTEDEICSVTTPSDSDQHDWDGLSNNEVEEPLGCCSESDVHGTKTSSWNLGNKNPADRTPSKLEDACEEEDADESNISEGGDRSSCLWWTIVQDKSTDDEHASCLCKRCPEKRLSASERVSSKKKESCASDNLANTVDTSSEETGLGTSNSKTLEDLWCIVIDSVGTGHLLANHESDGDESSLSVSWDGPHLALEIHEAGPTDQTSLHLKLFGHFFQLHADVRVVGGKVTNANQHSRCLLPVVLLGKETRSLVAQGDTDQHEDSWKHLHSQRDLPLRVSLAVKERSIVDPEGHHDSDGNVKLVDTSKTSTDRSRGVL